MSFCGLDHKDMGLCGGRRYAYNRAMEATSTHKGRTEKSVTIHDAIAATDEEVIRFAMARLGERRENLFGTHVKWHGIATATVTLYTD